jgi:hypothetical protein
MTYVVERDLPDFTAEQLGAAATRAQAAANEMSRLGVPIRYRRSIYLPSEEKCYCLFEGESADAIREVNERAGLPFNRIMEAIYIDSENLE